jgi:hypothetical protein
MSELAMVDEVVTRWVARPAGDLVTTLDRAPIAAELRLSTPFSSATDASGREIAWAYGRVGRVKVEVALTAWTAELTELTIRRHGRHLVTWGEGSERRYFDRAHEAASGIAAA